MCQQAVYSAQQEPRFSADPWHLFWLGVEEKVVEVAQLVGRLEGTGLCYDLVHSRELLPVLNRIQGPAPHVGGGEGRMKHDNVRWKYVCLI